MIKITASLRETPYAPVSPTTDFPVGFPIFGRNAGEFPATDIQVIVAGVKRTDFTVTGTFVDGVSTDAVVRMNVAVTGSVIVRGRRTPRRTDQYANGAPLPIRDHNYSLNRVEAEMQEVRRDVDEVESGLVETLAEVNAIVATERAERIASDLSLNNSISAEAATRANAISAIEARQIIAGNGLAGGGTHAATVTLALSSTSLASLALANSAVQPSRAILAGTGLSGGGGFDADRMISLSASSQASLAKADSAVQTVNGKSGTSITLNAGDVNAVPASKAEDIDANTLARHGHTNKLLLDATTASFTIELKDKLEDIDLALYEQKSMKDAPNGYAGLDADGKLNENQLPAIAITDTFVVETQAEMLALDVQRGDIAVRADLNKSFVLQSEPATDIANWIELRTPTDAVLSVVGLRGAISQSDLRDALGLGSAAFSTSSSFASASDGTLARSAVQPAALSAYALTEDLDEKANTSDLGALAGKDKAGITDLDTTGVASTATYLRGDGVWATPPGSGGGGGQVNDILAGSGINVNRTDPVNPTVSIDAATLAAIAANTSARHTHSNKGVLDATTASFTTTLKTKLDNLPADADKTPGVATTSANGLLSAEDKATIDGLTAAFAATEKTANKGQNNGYASLGPDGKIPSSQLPPVAITDTFVVNSQAAMLALTVQVGDIAVRTDLTKSFILRAEPGTVLANWQELLTPPNAVISVNGETGAVVITAGGIGAATETALSNLAQATTNELAGKLNNTGNQAIDGGLTLPWVTITDVDQPLYDNNVATKKYVVDAVASVGGLGINQSWSNPSRTAGVSYQNTTDRSIYVAVILYSTSASRRLRMSPNNADPWYYIGSSGSAGNGGSSCGGVVPPGWYYKVDSPVTIDGWAELR